MKGTWVPSWVSKNETPAFTGGGVPAISFGGKKYLWGNVPALDLLNVGKNEGIDDILHRDFNLLFAASGDLRNVIKTVMGLPKDYCGYCKILMNDREFLVVARNIMLLMTAYHFEAETAVPIMIHLWYSSTMPASMVDALIPLH